MTEEKKHLDSVERHFDEHSHTWIRLYEEPKIAHDLVLRDRNDFGVEFLSKYAGPGSLILDAGCGAGVAAMDLVEKGFRVHGVDIAPGMIAICEKNFAQAKIDPSRYEFSVGDLTRSHLEPGSFDGIIGLGFIEYQEDELEALHALNRLLRPGGVLVLSGPIRWSLASLFRLRDGYRKLRRLLDSNEVEPISVHQYSASRFRSLLRASDFEMIDYRRHGFANFHFPAGVRRVLYDRGADFALHRTLTRVSRWTPLDRFANDIIVAARK